MQIVMFERGLFGHVQWYSTVILSLPYDCFTVASCVRVSVFVDVFVVCVCLFTFVVVCSVLLFCVCECVFGVWQDRRHY